MPSTIKFDLIVNILRLNKITSLNQVFKSIFSIK